MTTVRNLAPERGATDLNEVEAGQGCTMETIGEIAAFVKDEPFPAVIFGNTDRAKTAAEALWLFARRTGLDGAGECPRSAVQDFMANLMHLCAQEGITSEGTPFSSLVSMAEMHFEEERENDL
ncbi:hypothetical protein [Erwinia aphidicola]